MTIATAIYNVFNFVLRFLKLVKSLVYITKSWFELFWFDTEIIWPITGHWNGRPRGRLIGGHLGHLLTRVRQWMKLPRGRSVNVWEPSPSSGLALQVRQDSLENVWHLQHNLLNNKHVRESKCDYNEGLAAKYDENRRPIINISTAVRRQFSCLYSR